MSVRRRVLALLFGLPAIVAAVAAVVAVTRLVTSTTPQRGLGSPDPSDESESVATRARGADAPLPKPLHAGPRRSFRRTWATRLAIAAVIPLLALPLSTALAASSAADGAGKGPEASNPGKGNKPSPKPTRTPTPTAAPTPTPTSPPTATPPATATPAPSSTPSAAPSVPTSGYSVATWGNDANSGSLSSPWRTLQKAASSVPVGQTVWIRGGTYDGFTMSRSGTSTAEITFTEYPGEIAVVQGSSTLKLIALNGVHDVTISRLTIQGAPYQYGAGIYIENGSYDVSIVNNLLRNNRSFGVKVIGSTKVAIINNTITDNETGIEVSGAGEGVSITSNKIYANDRMVVSDTTSWNDRGGNAIVFYKSTGRISVTKNTIYGNRAVSHDYGYDGGAFEIYASSNITMSDNVLWDNENVVETGTNGTACSNNVFTRNVAYHGSTTSVAGPAMGLILRCAGNMLVANNSFYGLDKFTFDVSLAGGFAGSIDGLRILNNVAVGADHPYSLDTAIPSTVSIDRNVIWNPSGGAIAYVYGKGNTTTRTQFTSWTGFDQAGIQADPQYLAGATGDLRIASTSPAIDKGAVISGFITSFLGLAPDIGRHETR